MNKRYLGWLITGLLVALFFMGQAKAQTRLYWDSNGNIVGSSSAAQEAQFMRDLTAYNKARNAGAIASASVSNGVVSVSRAATLEIPASSGLGQAVKVAVRDVVKHPVASLGKGVLTLARTTPLGLVGTVAGTILLDAGISYTQGQWQKQGTVPLPSGSTVAWSSTGWRSNYLPGNNTAEAAATANIPANCGPLSSFAVSRIVLNPDQVTATVYCRRLSDGAEFGASNISRDSPYVPPTGESAPATDADIAGAIESGVAARPDRAPELLQAIYDAGGWVPLDAVDGAELQIDTPKATGKQTQEVTRSTGSDGQTLTTTRTTTPTATVTQGGNTVSNNYVTYNVSNVTTTVITDQAGNVVGSSEETEPVDTAFTDPAMPGVPKLYDQKYPDGIAGVWRDNKPDVQGTAFYQGVASMFPSFGGGQCPVWRMSFNLGAAGNFGSGDLTVPCWIFQALGLVMLATAAFTARKILF